MTARGTETAAETVTRSRRARALSLVVVAGLVLGACGGDDDSGGKSDGGDTDGSDPTEEVTKADYIEAADAVCQAAQDSATAELEAASTIEEVAEVIVPVYRDILRDLRALDTPKGDEDVLATLYDDLETVVDQVEETPDVLTGTVDPFAEVDQAAQDYGFETCGSEGSSEDGGDTGDTSDTSDTSSDSGEMDAAKQAYIEAADAICVTYDDQINAIPAPITDEEFNTAVMQVADLTRQELEELLALPMPPGDEETLTAMYDSLGGALDDIEADPTIVQGEENPLAEAQQMAVDYGFQQCGSS